MTKQDLQKELLEKVKPGTKPSHLKKLKRSKSEGDIPASPSSEKQITQLQEQVKFHSQTASNYLQSLQTSQAKVSELEEKLKNNLPSQLTELDQSLMARHQNLKDWFTQYQKTKQLDQELQENIDESSQELINQDQTISQLRGQVKNLELTNQSLTKDLNLATRLAESRKEPLPENNPHSNLPVYAFLAFWFATLLLNSSWNHNFKHE